MFLNVIYKSLKVDTSLKRVKVRFFGFVFYVYIAFAVSLFTVFCEIIAAAW